MATTRRVCSTADGDLCVSHEHGSDSSSWLAPTPRTGPTSRSKHSARPSRAARSSAATRSYSAPASSSRAGRRPSHQHHRGAQSDLRPTHGDRALTGLSLPRQPRWWDHVPLEPGESCGAAQDAVSTTARRVSTTTPIRLLGNLITCPTSVSAGTSGQVVSDGYNRYLQAGAPTNFTPAATDVTKPLIRAVRPSLLKWGLVQDLNDVFCWSREAIDAQKYSGGTKTTPDFMGRTPRPWGAGRVSATGGLLTSVRTPAARSLGAGPTA